MPNYKGHLVGGFFFYLITLFIIGSFFMSVSLATKFEWLLFTLAGSLFPDIDTKSKGQKFFYILVFLLAIFLLAKNKITSVIILLFFCLVPLMVHHRGLFHRLWFIIATPAIISFIICCYLSGCNKIVFFDTVFFIVGAVSHLWLDLGFRRMLRL